VGLEGIRGASYALNVPAKQNGLWYGFGGTDAATTSDAYTDIAEVRAVSGAATCNQLLADGWVLLGVYPITTVAEMTPQDPDGEQRKQDIQRYVRRFVGYVVGKRRA
jgi:hypothetical protein